MKTEQIGAPEAHSADPQRTHTSETSVSRTLAAPSLSSLTPRPIAPALERWVERCMAKDPRERFASTQAALEALAAAEVAES